MRKSYFTAAASAAALLLAPGATLACACGCGIFDVGDDALMPNNANSGLAVWFRLAYMDQNQNWAGREGVWIARRRCLRVGLAVIG